MEDPDSVADCTRRSFYGPMSKVPRYCTMVNWSLTDVHGSDQVNEEEEKGMGLLGADQILAIIQHLPAQAVISFGMTCKRYKALADTDALWAYICKREWGSRAVEAWPTAGRHKIGWKRLYRQMLTLGAAAWHQVHQGDVLPAPRASHSMNAVNGRITIFGGGSDGGRHLDDTWTVAVPEQPADGVSWQQVCFGSPSGRFGQSCAAVGDMLVLFGGINDNGTRLSDTFINRGVLAPNEAGTSPWQMLEVTIAPPPRGAHAGCYAGDLKVVIFGGIGSDGTRLGDTWMLDLAVIPHHWQEIVTPFSPRPRSGHTLTWVGGKRMVLFGGRGADFEVVNDVWILDMEGDYPAWVEIQGGELHPAHDCPSPRSGHSATLIFGGRVLIFGGEDSKRARKGDVWVLDPSVGFQATNNPTCRGSFMRHRSCANSSNNKYSRRLWKRLKQWGRPPSKRSFHSACAVDSGHVILIFGGMVDGELVPALSGGLGFDAELHMLQLVP